MGKTGGFLLPPKPSNFLLGLIIFFSATQLGLHLWPLSSLVYGIRLDYLSPTFYFLDLLIILFLGLRRLLDRRPEHNSSRDTEGGRSLLMGILPILLTNLLFSANPLATLSWSLHFLLYFLFVNLLSFRLISSSYLLIPLSTAMLFQTTLAATQVVLGHSIGGLFYYLGERTIAVGQPAIATAMFLGETVLRGYGTFGHPNVLAGWLVVCLLILIKLAQGKSDPTFSSYKGRIFVITSTLTTIVAVLLAQSRAAALALVGLVIPFYLFKNLKTRLLYFVFILYTLYSIPNTLFPSRSDLSLSERLNLQSTSLSIIQALPVFGTGAQASLTTYPVVSPSARLLQPDHNTFTLFLSWFGIFGVLAALYNVRICLGFRISHLGFLVPLLPLLLLDHYFLTSPQGLFILIFYAKLSSCSK